MLYTRFMAVARLIKEHGLITWFPNLFAGMPVSADHTTPFYIFTLLNTLLPMWLIHHGVRIAFSVLSGWGMYLLLKRYFNVSREIAFCLGIIFCLIGQYGTVVKGFNFLFPIFWVCLLNCLAKESTRSARVLSAVLLLLLFWTSFPVLTLPYFSVVSCMMLFFHPDYKKYNLSYLKIIVIWGCYFLMALPLIYELLDFVQYKQREYQFTASYIEFFIERIQIVYAYFFDLKFSSLVILFLGFFRVDRHLRRFSGLVLFPLLFLVPFIPPYPPFFKNTFLPQLDLFHFKEISALMAFILAGLLLQKARFEGKGIMAYWKTFPLALLWLALHIKAGPLTDPELIVEIFVFLGVVLWLFLIQINKATRKMLVCSGLAGLLILGIFYKLKTLNWEHQPYLRLYYESKTLDKLRQELKESPFRVASFDSLANVVSAQGLESVSGRSLLQPQAYKDLFEWLISPQLDTSEKTQQYREYWYQIYLRDYRFIPKSDERISIPKQLNWNALLLLNTKYLVAPYYDESMAAYSKNVETIRQAHCEDNYKKGLTGWLLDRKLEQKKIKAITDKLKMSSYGYTYDSIYDLLFCPEYTLYELNDYFERAYLVDNVKVLATSEDMLAALKEATVDELRSTVYFSEDANIIHRKDEPATSTKFTGNVRFRKYSPDEIILEGHTSEPTYLIVSNSYYHKWVATLNGKVTPIYRANHAFQGIWINQAGEFALRLEYVNPAFYWLNLFGVVGTIILVVSLCRQPNIPLPIS
ncbi:MAG TPA: hypothetical protein VI749_09010 [Candidatus Omnitrophota bacterium]|nr:hypothetical protein [Candidatus Omnitrophota bacterium]